MYILLKWFCFRWKKCIKCNNISQGGIEGCTYHNKNGNSISCSTYNKGYILLSKNKTCLKISQNEELKKYNNCWELYLNNNMILIFIIQIIFILMKIILV